MNNTDPTIKPRVNSGTREGKAVPTSYKTPAMLLIYTVNTCWPQQYAPNRNNINTTLALLQTSGGSCNPNIVFISSTERPFNNIVSKQIRA